MAGHKQLTKGNAMPKIDVNKAEQFPYRLSMRMSALKVFGGILDNHNDSSRLEQPYWRSRYAGHKTRKDFRVTNHKYYKPWQYRKDTPCK